MVKKKGTEKYTSQQGLMNHEYDHCQLTIKRIDADTTMILPSWMNVTSQVKLTDHTHNHR